MSTVATPVLVYLALVALIALAISLIGFLNLLEFRRPRAFVTGSPDELPFVSILIPARDEEQNIEACVRRALAQNYPAFEVVVIDDNSSDATYDILCHIRDQDPRLRVLAGALLPDGWAGKTFAVHQLANAARGEWLLMTDADCELLPDALLFALGGAREHRADLLTLDVDPIYVTFAERLLLPILTLLPLSMLPLRLAADPRYALLTTANGQFLFMRKDLYEAVGGFAAVRGEIVEDLAFARHVKQHGFRVWWGDGKRVCRVRMYRSLGDIWAGFTRYIFPSFSSGVASTAAAIAFVLAVFVLPPVLCVALAHHGASVALLALAPYLLFVSFRFAVAWRTEQDDPLMALLNPLAWAFVAAVGIGSLIQMKRSGVVWRGRVYHRLKAPGS